MILEWPLSISSRLLPSVKVGDDYLSIDFDNNSNSWCFYIDAQNGTEFSGDGLRGRFSDIREVFACLFDFMGACIESIRYSRHTGERGENCDLFSPEIAEWIEQNQTQIEYLRLVLSEESEEIDEID